jgi:nickel transport protein
MRKRTINKKTGQGAGALLPGGALGLVLVAFVVILMNTPPAWAHKVYVFAWVEAGMVYTESSFGDQPVHGGAIEVVDTANRVVLRGNTDDQGKFNFPVPSSVTSDLLIKLDATMGHQAQWKLTRSELIAVGEKAEQQLSEAMTKKAHLEAKPSMVAVAGGIAVIFLICGIVSVINKRRKQQNG